MEYALAEKDGKPLVLTDKEFQDKRREGLQSTDPAKREYYFKIGADSSTLLETLSNESKFAEAAVSIVEGYKDTSYNTVLE